MHSDDNPLNSSIYVIKPEMMQWREQIRRYLLWKTGLTLESYILCELTEDDIRTTNTDDLNPELFAATVQHFAGQIVEVGLVKGERAAEKLVAAAGHSPNDAECEPGTIRWLFGLREIKMYGQITYFLNSLHKASVREAPVAVDWYAKRAAEIDCPPVVAPDLRPRGE